MPPPDTSANHSKPSAHLSAALYRLVSNLYFQGFVQFHLVHGVARIESGTDIAV